MPETYWKYEEETQTTWCLKNESGETVSTIVENTDTGGFCLLIPEFNNSSVQTTLGAWEALWSRIDAFGSRRP